ncbi:MAG: hypothetical protein K2X81_09665, partial [Candidatus Obscuribacterales bacterium]|nr:hypothetical protein [Candidatus Obscuribacterales bacterium]
LQWTRLANKKSFAQESSIVHSVLFTSSFQKRSLETPARGHPRDEQVEIERMSKDELLGCDNPDEGAGISPEESNVLNLLSATPIHFDIILEKSMMTFSALVEALTMLELSGKIERLWGDLYVRRIPRPAIMDQSEHIQMELNDFLDFVRVNFGGISRKYLQLYLAAYWCSSKSIKSSATEVLNLCFRSFPDVNENHYSYTTPLLVHIFSEDVLGDGNRTAA